MMLLEGFLDDAFEFAQLFGLPVLCLIFVSKGLLIGKIFPTSLFLPGYVIATGASLTMAGIIAVATGISYVVGQTVVYWGCRKYGISFVEDLPYADIDTESPKFHRFEVWFRRYGGLSLFVTNFVPWIRGLVTIPAGTMDYPVGRYLFYTTSSTVTYHFLYVALGLGVLELIDWL